MGAVPDASEVLRQLAFLDVPEADLTSLASVSFPRRISKGQVLFSEGERSDMLYVIVSGRVKVLVSSPRGEELVVVVLGPGEQLGELSVLDGTSRSASAVALDDVELLCVPGEALLAFLRKSPAASLALAQELAGRLRRMTIISADLVFLDLPRRLAKLLLAGAEGSGIQSLVQSDVAAQLGVTRQSLNRSLQRLQERGWVAVHRTRVEVLEPAALAAFAES